VLIGNTWAVTSVDAEAAHEKDEVAAIEGHSKHLVHCALSIVAIVKVTRFSVP
jgi:hypothetical protein